VVFTKYCTVLYCTVLYCTVLYCTALYCNTPHSTPSNCTSLSCSVQSYNRDLFIFMYAMLVVVAGFTSLTKHVGSNLATGKSIQYLNRHQTEEWKGWMQVQCTTTISVCRCSVQVALAVVGYSPPSPSMWGPTWRRGSPTST